MKVAAREAIAQTLERGAFVARRAFARSNSAAARHAIRSAPLRNEYRRISNGSRRAVGGARLGGRSRPSGRAGARSEEHTLEIQSLMRILHAVICFQKKISIEQAI